MFIISLIFQAFDKMRAYKHARVATALNKRTQRKDLKALEARKKLEAARDALKAEREAEHNQFIENAINHLPKIEADAKAKRDKLLATEEAERKAAVNAERKAAVNAERKAAVKAEAKAKRKAAVEAEAERKAVAEAEAERKAAAEADANQQQQSCKCHLYNMGCYVCSHTLAYALSQQNNQQYPCDVNMTASKR